MEAMQVTQVGRARSRDQAAVDLREATDTFWLLGTSFVPAAYKTLKGLLDLEHIILTAENLGNGGHDLWK